VVSVLEAARAITRNLLAKAMNEPVRICGRDWTNLGLLVNADKIQIKCWTVPVSCFVTVRVLSYKKNGEQESTDLYYPQVNGLNASEFELDQLPTERTGSNTMCTYLNNHSLGFKIAWSLQGHW
jgi:hypothetical protein